MSSAILKATLWETPAWSCSSWVVQNCHFAPSLLWTVRRRLSLHLVAKLVSFCCSWRRWRTPAWWSCPSCPCRLCWRRGLWVAEDWLGLLLVECQRSGWTCSVMTKIHKKYSTFPLKGYGWHTRLDWLVYVRTVTSFEGREPTWIFVQQTRPKSLQLTR